MATAPWRATRGDRITSGVTRFFFRLGLEEETVANAAGFGDRLLDEAVAGVGAEGDEAIAVRALRLKALADVRHLFPEARFAAAARNPDLFGHAGKPRGQGSRLP
jgi:hypothetical protein